VGSLAFLSLFPYILASIAPFLKRIFYVFKRLLLWKGEESSIPPIVLQQPLVCFFHHLYGLFPSNFMRFIKEERRKSAEFKTAVRVISLRLLFTSSQHHSAIVEYC